MATGSLLDDYLKKKLPGYTPGTLSKETVAFAAALDSVARELPDVAGAILQELRDQRSKLKLIASENFASPAVLLAMGNWLSDKYAEGSPGHRFYAGCDNVDAIESRAAELARDAVRRRPRLRAAAQRHRRQPGRVLDRAHRARREPGARAARQEGRRRALAPTEWETLRRELGNQKMMGMALDSGGHLTHGFRPNVSGKLFRTAATASIPRPACSTTTQVRKRAQRGAAAAADRRRLQLATRARSTSASSARSPTRSARRSWSTWRTSRAGRRASVFTGDFDPVAHAHIVTTTTHKTLRGPRGGLVLCQKELAETVDRGCPLVLGGPLPHVMAAKAVALHEAAQARLRATTRSASSTTRARSPRR